MIFLSKSNESKLVKKQDNSRSDCITFTRQIYDKSETDLLSTLPLGTHDQFGSQESIQQNQNTRSHGRESARDFRGWLSSYRSTFGVDTPPPRNSLLSTPPQGGVGGGLYHFLT